MAMEKETEDTTEQERNRNMYIWDQVDETDPDNTKKVKFGREFTAIDAYSQIKKATEVFGPCGDGWGWTKPELSYIGEGHDLMLVVQLEVWHVDEDRRGPWCIPIVTSHKVYQHNTKSDTYKIDDEVFKKTVTDAITKGLSYLGFNADVFLGKFDDNRYVTELRRKAKEVEGNSKVPKPTQQGSAGGISDKQKEMIANLQEDAEVTGPDMLKVLKVSFGGKSIAGLTREEAANLIGRLETKAAQASLETAKYRNRTGGEK